MSERKESGKFEKMTSQNIKIKCPNIGDVQVFLEGPRATNEVVILTVHDLGCDHTMYKELIQHPKMAPIRSRTVWVNVDIPGQSQGASDLPDSYQFPTMQEIAHDLVHILNELNLHEVICLGEGAGANILARFAMANVEKVLGVCLMHTTGTNAGLLESLKDKILSWKLDSLKINQSAESYLALHRFGEFNKADDAEELKEVVSSYQGNLRKMNAKNLKLYVEAFLNRTSILEGVRKLSCPVLLVSGQLSIFNSTTRAFHQSLMKEAKDKSKVEYIEVAGVANVLEEKPDKLIECFQYFLQGLGVVSSVPMQNVAKPPRGRSMSMQDYDVPMRQRLFSAQIGEGITIFDEKESILEAPAVVPSAPPAVVPSAPPAAANV